jgi:hypothetical protein
MKVRADSVLKTLPDGRQQEIFEWLNTPGNTLVRCVQWLAQDGIKTNKDSLSDWYSWYVLRLKFKETERDAKNFQEFVREQIPDLPAEKVTALGDSYFNMQAIKAGDPKLFLAMQTAKHKAQMDHLKLGQRERELVLSEKRFRRETCELFMDWFQDARAREIASNTEEPKSDRVEKLGKLIFKEDW